MIRYQSLTVAVKYQPTKGYFSREDFSQGGIFPGGVAFSARRYIPEVFFRGGVFRGWELVALQSLSTFKKVKQTFNFQSNNKTELINVINKKHHCPRGKGLEVIPSYPLLKVKVFTEGMVAQTLEKAQTIGN